MIRVLLIARYHNHVMAAKYYHLQAEPDLQVRLIYPSHWENELKDPSPTPFFDDQAQTTPIIGKANDPHRSLYRSFTLGLRRFAPHIIHAEEEPDSLSALQMTLARRLFAPKAKLLLHTWQNLDRPLSRPAQWVLHRTLAAADAVFCANQEAAALLQQRGYTRPTPVIPAVGVDTDAFPPRTPPANQTFTVGFIGRLSPEKGIDVLVDALAQTRSQDASIHLRIIGSGPQQDQLRQQVARLALNDQVSFIAALPPAQVAEQMALLDALVLPSRTTPVWKEQLGRVLIEAMSIGVPVIGADSGAIPEVIGDAGLVFAEGSATALAEQLLSLVHRPDLAAQLVVKGRRRVETLYSQKVLAARTAAFYRQILCISA